MEPGELRVFGITRPTLFAGHGNVYRTSIRLLLSHGAAACNCLQVLHSAPTKKRSDHSPRSVLEAPDPETNVAKFQQTAMRCEHVYLSNIRPPTQHRLQARWRLRPAARAWGLWPETLVCVPHLCQYKYALLKPGCACERVGCAETES